MATMKEIEEVQKLLAEELDLELRAFSHGFQQFARSTTNNPAAQSALTQAETAFRDAAALVEEGKRFMQTKPVVTENKVSLNPQLLQFVRRTVLDFQYLRNSSNFKDNDIIAFHAILVPADNMKETQALMELMKIHKELRQNLSRDLGNIVNKAPQQLKEALTRLKIYPKGLGPLEIRDVNNWYPNAEAGRLEELYNQILGNFNKLNDVTKNSFIESLKDPSKQHMFNGGAKLVTDFLDKDAQGQELVKSLKGLRGELFQYERMYYKIYTLLEEVMRLIEAYYNKPDEFAKLTGKA
ncbi:MAG: hypothetical protein ABIJ21_04550 [Nanoarchaeota archaeon]